MLSKTKLLLFLAAVPFSCLPVIAQSYTPQRILFKGETGYTNDELMAAAGLKKGVSLTPAQMNAETKALMDTGFFQDVSFTFNGLDLVFHISPAVVLVPIKLENVPLISAGDLDARLHAHFPLYHGKVPTEGTFVDDVRHELEEALKEKGITAQLLAAPFTDQKSASITYETFTITSPDVSIGAIQVNGASAELSPLVSRAASRVTGNAYSTESSPSQIETALNNVYGERGYLGATFKITAGATPVVDAAGIHIPYTVDVTEGSPYRLAAIHLDPSLIVSQEIFDKQLNIHPGDVVSLAKLRDAWEYLTLQYHNKGCMQAQIHAEPSFDRTAGTVTYNVTATPGPTFAMGALRVVNVPDDLHDALQTAWKIPAGAVFDESSVRKLAYSPNLAPELRRALTSANIQTSLKIHEALHTVDVELTLVRKSL